MPRKRLFIGGSVAVCFADRVGTISLAVYRQLRRRT
jgi:hypothetical protein